MPGPMYNSPADVLRYAAISLGLGTLPPDTNWPIYVGQEPPSPDNVLTFYDIAGRDNGRSMVGGERATLEGVQVRSRSRTHLLGYAKIQAVATAFDTDVYDKAVTIDGRNYVVHCVVRTSNVLAPGKENLVNELSIFTLNVLVSVRQRA